MKTIQKEYQKTKPFVNQHNWKDIDFPSHQKYWKKFEKNNATIALDILFVPYNTKEIRAAYKSKNNNGRENEVILLMITDGKKWHYLALKSERTFDGEKWRNHAVTNLSRVLIGITWRFLLFKLLSFIQHRN